MNSYLQPLPREGGINGLDVLFRLVPNLPSHGISGLRILYGDGYRGNPMESARIPCIRNAHAQPQSKSSGTPRAEQRRYIF